MDWSHGDAVEPVDVRKTARVHPDIQRVLQNIPALKATVVLPRRVWLSTPASC